MAFRGIEESIEAGERALVAPPATDLRRWSLEVCEGRQVNQQPPTHVIQQRCSELKRLAAACILIGID